jgi:hypothetical protein
MKSYYLIALLIISFFARPAIGQVLPLACVTYNMSISTYPCSSSTDLTDSSGSMPGSYVYTAGYFNPNDGGQESRDMKCKYCRFGLGIGQCISCPAKS